MGLKPELPARLRVYTTAEVLARLKVNPFSFPHWIALATALSMLATMVPGSCPHVSSERSSANPFA